MTLRTKAISFTGVTLFTAILGAVFIAAYLAEQASQNPMVQNLMTGSLTGLILTIPSIFLYVLNKRKTIELEEKLAALVTTDALTGLSNRRRFEAHYAHERARSERTAETMCLLLMEVDGAEAHMQRFGQEGHDEIIVHLADYLSLTLRSGTDEVARWSDDQFMILLTETSFQGGVTTAERLRQRIEGLNLQLNDQTVRVTVSVGMVTCRPGEILESVLGKVEDCVAAGKRMGPNTIIPHSEAQPELVVVTN